MTQIQENNRAHVRMLSKKIKHVEILFVFIPFNSPVHEITWMFNMYITIQPMVEFNYPNKLVYFGSDGTKIHARGIL